MKTLNKSTFFHSLMILTVLALLFGLTGGVSVKAAEPSASHIVQATTTQLAYDLVQKVGGKVTSRLDIIRAVASDLTTTQVGQLRSEKGITSITPNGKVKTSDSNNAPAQSATLKSNKFWAFK
jgi:hypothetical protein